jgi:hypothetical protein
MSKFAQVGDFCPNEACPDYGKLQKALLASLGITRCRCPASIHNDRVRLSFAMRCASAASCASISNPGPRTTRREIRSPSFLRTQSESSCVACAYSSHADHVAAVNLSRWSAVNQPDVSGRVTQGQAPPQAVG